MYHEGIGQYVYKIGKLFNLYPAIFPMRHEGAIKLLIRSRFPARKALGMEPAKRRARQAPCKCEAHEP